MAELEKLWDALTHSHLLPALLPIAQEDAPISARSKIKSIGKTPALYNAQGEVFGFKNWTNRETEMSEAKTWAKDPRLGIGIRARYLRAFDVDIDNADAVKMIVEGITCFDAFKNGYAYRYRKNSPRVLIPFIYEGECPKKQYKLDDGGMVELLGDGQFWVAYGKHPSGVDYEWVKSPLDAPVLTAQDLERIEALLTMALGATLAGSSSKLRSLPLTTETTDEPDPVADYLKENGWVLQEYSDRLLIRCPNADAHTSGEDGDGSTVWFKAGTNGYDMGHFRCLHSHCSDIDDDKFLKLIGCEHPGVSEEDFADVPVVVDEVPPLKLSRRKNGQIIADLHNVTAFLESKVHSHVHLVYDTFLQMMLIALPGEERKRQFQDSDYVELRLYLGECGFESVGKEVMIDAVAVVASRNQEDSALSWVKRLPEWDGVPRCATFFIDYCHAESSEVNRFMGTYLWASLAGRVIQPGVKADVMVVLRGDQGLRKSSLISSLVPEESLYGEISLDMRTQDIYRTTAGKLVIEIPELAGMSKKDVESLKAMLSSTTDRFTNKYDRHAKSFARRYMFIGSTNQETFLMDTENRRFAVVEIPQTIDIDRIVDDREQLWAEAVYLFNSQGICQQELEQAVRDCGQNAKYRVEDPWQEKIEIFLRGTVGDGENLPDLVEFSASELLEHAIKVRVDQASPKDTRRVGTVMKALGYCRKNAKRKGLVTSSYVRKA